MASNLELSVEDVGQCVLNGFSSVASAENINDVNESIDISTKKSRRSYVMEDLGQVRHSMNIKKWIMEQVEMKLCLNKEELYKDLREKDVAIHKLQEELENLRVTKEASSNKSSNLPKVVKNSVSSKKAAESDSKLPCKPNSVTLKRDIKIDEKCTASSVVKTRINSVNNTGRLPTGGKINSESVKGATSVSRGIFRSKTFRGETSHSKEISNRNTGQKSAKPEERKHFPNVRRGLNNLFQDNHFEHNGNSVTVRQTESAMPFDNEIAANLRRLTEEHSKLQAEYARVRTLLMEANTKCASGLNSPIPPDRDNASVSDQSEDLAKSVVVDSDKVQNLNESLDFDCNDGSRDGFRKEVLRLKEELLAFQHQNRILLDSKSQLDQDLIDRERVILQLSKQIEQRNVQQQDIIAEKELNISKLEKLVCSLEEKLSDMEREFNETKEFLQEESNTLNEALRDSEEKSWQNSSDMEKLKYQLETKEKRCDMLSKMNDQVQSQLRDLQLQLNETQDNAQSLIVKQGTEINEVTCAVKELHDLVLNLRGELIEDASAFGVDIGSSPDNKVKSRRSIDGRRLVQAILEAAKSGSNNESSKEEGSSSGDTFQSSDQNGFDTSNHLSTVNEVKASIVTLGKMCRRFANFVTSLVEEADEEKNKLENELLMARMRSEDLQKEVEDSCRKRWSIEEKNKDLTKEVTEIRVSLRDARDSLKEMWAAVDEKASWLIENKKLREEIALLKNHLSELETDRNLLSEELKSIINQNSSETTQHLNGNNDSSEGKYDALLLKQQIANMQRQILNKEEEYQDTKKKHERLLQKTNKNLHQAELELQKLDKIIDHVLQVLINAHDLEIHPVLQQLWKDLDGPGYVATKFDESATIV